MPSAAHCRPCCKITVSTCRKFPSESKVPTGNLSTRLRQRTRRMKWSLKSTGKTTINRATTITPQGMATEVVRMAVVIVCSIAWRNKSKSDTLTSIWIRQIYVNKLPIWLKKMRPFRQPYAMAGTATLYKPACSAVAKPEMMKPANLTKDRTRYRNFTTN